MTTIAYRDGILAADSMAFGGQYCASPGEKQKVWRLKNGDMLGVSSPMVGAGEAVRDHLEGELAKEELPAEFIAILVKADGGVFYARGAVRWSGPLDADYYAIGSGADFALGAMATGAGSFEAVEAAIKHDQHTGGSVRVLTRCA